MTVFVRAAELGSFAAAAAALDLSAPMVGKHVQALETALGGRLLHRTTRRQSLTDLGRAYYERCRTVLAELAAADELAADLTGEPVGRLRVALPAHLGRRCLAPTLIALAARHPRLELDLSFSDRFVDLVEDGFDLAVRTGRLADRAGMTARLLGRQPMVVCASPEYLARHGAPRSASELSDHTAIAYRRSGRVKPWIFPREDGSRIEVAPAHRLRLDDMDAMADAASQGLGLVWLPYWLVRSRLEAGSLVLVMPDQAPFLYDVHAVWLSTLSIPRKVRLAIDALAVDLPPQLRIAR